MTFRPLVLLAFSSLLSLSAHAQQISCKDFDAAVAKGSDVAKLNAFSTKYWDYLMREYPEWASFVGYPGQDARLTDQSVAAFNRRTADKKCQLKALNRIQRASLKGEDRINLDLLLYTIQRYLDEDQFGGRYLVMDQMAGPVVDMPDLLEAMPRSKKADYENRLKRLEAFPQQLEQFLVWMREGLKLKITPAKFLMEKVPAQFDKIVTAKVEDSPLYESFKEAQPDDASEAELNALRERARAVLTEKVFPALKNARVFLEKEYIPGARENIAATSLPDGARWYAFNVKTQTTTDKTPEELHQLGLDEVARIRGEMEKIRTEVGFKGDLKAFNKMLMTDKKFFFKDAAEVLSSYRSIAKQIDPELPKLFKKLPRLTYGVREMPDYKAPTAPDAYYMSGSLAAGRAGYFEANTYKPETRANWCAAALTMHEAVPGHHFQIAIGQEIEHLPEFRKHGGFTAFIEGWGLYAESLGDQIGIYKTPYEKYGQLTFEMWRAARLVVDTGMHQLGWSRQKAVDYFLEQMAASQHEAEVEIDRYIAWPGQALAYKVGQLKFLELRERARKELGTRFDVRDYHDEVLSHSSLPLSVLEKTFGEWLARKKAEPTSPKKLM